MAENNTSGPVSDPSDAVRLLVAESVGSLEKVLTSEIRRLSEALTTHLAYTKEMSANETKRVNALRAVDINAVAIASSKADAQALVLANQVATSAETLRVLVASTATAVANELRSVSTQLTDRISLLEKAQYENMGKSGASSTLLNRVDELEAVRQVSKGRSELSVPLLMLLASLGGGILIFIIETIMRSLP
jgi:hypothetical protein